MASISTIWFRTRLLFSLQSTQYRSSKSIILRSVRSTAAIQERSQTSPLVPVLTNITVSFLSFSAIAHLTQGISLNARHTRLPSNETSLDSTSVDQSTCRISERVARFLV